MTHIEVKTVLKGTGSLIMNNVESANPLSAHVKKIADLNRQKKRKDVDKAEVTLQLNMEQWRACFYFDPKIGPYIPSKWFRACMRAGARQSREGKSIERAVYIEQFKFPLIYEGPRTINELEQLQEFSYTDMVTVNMKKVLKMRPRFEDWSCNFSFKFDSDGVSAEVVERALRRGGTSEGIGDFRCGGYGRFTVESFKMD